MAELKRGWRVILAAMIGIATGVAGMFFYSVGLFLKPVSSEFAWSRGELSTVSLVAGLSLAATAPAIGWLADRVDVRRLVLFSSLGLASGFVLLSRTGPNLAGYLVLIGLTVVLGAGVSPVVYTRPVNERFDKARGVALGLTLAAAGVVGAVMPPLLAPFIAEHGWRAGYLALAAVVIIALPFTLLLLGRRRGAPKIGSQSRAGMGLPSVLRDRSMGWMTVMVSLSGIGIGGVMVHLVPLLTDAGASPARAGGVAGLLGLSIMVGRLVTGYAVDRIFAPHVATVVFCLAACGCLVLAWTGPAAAPLGAILVGLGMGAELDLLSYLVARYFGMHAYGQTYGLLFAFFNVSGAIGPVIAGASFDHFRNYRYGFTALALLLVLSALAALRLGPFRDFETGGVERTGAAPEDGR